MSHVNPARRRSAARTELPTWSGAAIIAAALLTGILLSLNGGQIGHTYLIIFAVASVIATILVRVSGLYLTVASIPLLFGVETFIGSWFVVHMSGPKNMPAFSKTTLITALYPLLQYFPWLIGVTVVCGAIAYLRIYLRSRRRDRELEERRRRYATKSGAQQVTVSELIERRKNRETQTPLARKVRSGGSSRLSSDD